MSEIGAFIFGLVAGLLIAMVAVYQVYEERKHCSRDCGEV